MKIGEHVIPALGDALVHDAAGGEYRLGELWTSRDVVIIFVRHFACAGCAAHVAALRPRLGELVRLDVGVAVIGSGSPDQLAGFVDRELAGEPVAAFTDPTLASYRAAGLVRSRWSTYGPRALVQLGRALLRGFGNGAVQGDPLQQGGTLYIARGGELWFYDRASATGDHAALGDVVEVALARAVEAAS